MDWKERIAVEFLVELLAEGWTHAQILKNYPHFADDVCMHLPQEEFPAKAKEA